MAEMNPKPRDIFVTFITVAMLFLLLLTGMPKLLDMVRDDPERFDFILEKVEDISEEERQESFHLAILQIEALARSTNDWDELSQMAIKLLTLQQMILVG